ncbi:serine hydrolase domain-containing protein [Algoriphagus litoralis]|uniref:serine hydrolase domain-containing protein n=1 Tax=Algoriphagus litoralis TaxID=2202829 RepID=UPI001300AE24|nr:serine hydrolase domain-containing protein [Algoriphagus litoralis]
MRVLLAFVLVLFQTSVILAQSPLSPDLIQKLDSIAKQDVPAKAPGIATAIIQNGAVIYAKYAGIADLADSSLIDKSTRFNIASNGKQFTALAVLSLVSDEKLKLDSDIRAFFPNLFPDIKSSITVKMLLNHTSGIRDCYDLWSLMGYTWWKQGFDNADVLHLLAAQKELNFDPDSAYSYSNSNYILLALIVEKVSGKTFREFTSEMFQKLNMPNTAFESDHTSIKGPIARAYFNFSSWTTYDWIWEVVGDGNLFTTLENQIQWEKLVQGNGKSAFDPKLIEESQQTLTSSKFPNYGYGLEFGQYQGLDYAYHEGATGAWKATVVRFPKQNYSFLTLTNTGKSIPSSQTRQMVDAVFGLEETQNTLITKPERIGEYVSDSELLGTYLTEDDFAFTFEMREDKIFLLRVGRNDVELERESANVFRQKFDPAFKQEFTTNAQGERQVTAYYINHSPYSLIKTKPIRKDFDYKGIDGEYLNSETETQIRIEHLGGENYEITFRGEDKSKGLLVSDTKILVDFYSFEFQDSGFLLNGGRVKRVKFERVD